MRCCWEGTGGTGTVYRQGGTACADHTPMLRSQRVRQWTHRHVCVTGANYSATHQCCKVGVHPPAPGPARAQTVGCEQSSRSTRLGVRIPELHRPSLNPRRENYNYPHRRCSYHHAEFRHNCTEHTRTVSLEENGSGRRAQTYWYSKSHHKFDTLGVCTPFSCSRLWSTVTAPTSQLQYLQRRLHLRARSHQ